MRTASKHVGRKRMLKLIDHLEEKPRGEFRYSAVVAPKDEEKYDEREYLPWECPTVACVIGSCPLVFPHLMKYISTKDSGWQLAWKDTGDMTHYDYAGMELFGLTFQHSVALFTPNKQHFIGYPNLDRNATPKQVAKMLRRYVKEYMS
jgi:hypothetical protein